MRKSLFVAWLALTLAGPVSAQTPPARADAEHERGLAAARRGLVLQPPLPPRPKEK